MIAVNERLERQIEACLSLPDHCVGSICHRSLRWFWADDKVRVCALLSKGGHCGAGFGSASSDDAVVECVELMAGADVRHGGIAVHLLDTYLDKIQQHH